MRKRLCAIALLLSAGTLGSAQAASVREQQSNFAWHRQDLCAHDAFVKFPDYTVASNGMRADAIRACESRNHVLQRPPSNVSPVRRIPDSAAE